MQVAVGYRQRNDGFGLLPNNDLRDFESHNRAVPIGLTQHGQAEGNEVITGIRDIDSFAHDVLQSKERRLFAVALVGRAVAFGERSLVMQLSKDCLELFRNGQTQPGSIFEYGNTFIGQVEADHCAAQGFVGADHIQVDNVRHAHQHDDQHLLEDALEADGRRQLLVHDGTHDARDVVQRHQDDQRSHKAINTSNEIAEPAAKSGYGNLNLRPDQVNSKVPHSQILLMS